MQPEMPNMGSERKQVRKKVTCLGVEENQSLPASSSPSECANHRAAARSGCPEGGGPPLPGCGIHMATESIWQTGCGYRVLGGKEYVNAKTL